MTEITTPRLILRPVTLQDAPFIQENFAQDDILRYLRPPVPYPVYPPGAAVVFLQNVVLPQAAKGLNHTFLIQRKTDLAPMGCVGLTRDTEDSTEWSRGFWLAAAYRGDHVMEEASLAATRWLFTHTSATELEVCNAVTNKASARIKEKHGFLNDGFRTATPPYHNGDTIEQIWLMSRECFFRLHGE